LSRRRTPLRLATAGALAAVAVTGMSACNPLTPAPPASSTTTANPAAAYEARILTLLNGERAKAHLRPVAMIGCADGYANSWAATMARTGNFAHQSLTPIMRACAATRAGENIAYGNVSADQMMTMWMNSPGHRANILNPNYTHVGIGAVLNY
jgi:uncharacterized protein YkwD